MLVLTRKVGETIVIRDDIRVKIAHIQGGQVRIGIEAPASVEIYREELYDKVKNTLHTAKKSKGLLDKLFASH